MHIATINAVSLDGFTAKSDGSPTHEWTSPEDWSRFVEIRDQYQVLIMDLETYQAVRPTPDAQWLRVVLTEHPARYAEEAVKGQIEFLSASPKELVSQLIKRGYSSLLIVGGSQINSDFLAAQLVEDFFITFEPIILGGGEPVVSPPVSERKLQLQAIEQLNKGGTLFAHYRVIS